jgi:hypothetical protein
LGVRILIAQEAPGRLLGRPGQHSWLWQRQEKGRCRKAGDSRNEAAACQENDALQEANDPAAAPDFSTYPAACFAKG